MVMPPSWSLDQVLILPSVPYARRDLLPDGPGLYFLVLDDEKVLYVGISRRSIRHRWGAHHRVGTVNGLDLSTRIAFIEESDPVTLRRSERGAVAALRPKLNRSLRKWQPLESSGADLILLSIAAEEVGYTPERLRQLIRDGKITAEHRGRLILLRESEIQRIKDTMPGGYQRRRQLRCAETGPRKHRPAQQP